MSFAACSTGEFLTGSSGFFSSPNFPNSYPQYSRCTWNITVPSGYIIKVSFLHFQLNYRWRGGAQLTITNVRTGVVTLNGDSLPDPVYSVANSIQVTFISRANQYPGFNASYTAITYESRKSYYFTLYNVMYHVYQDMLKVQFVSDRSGRNRGFRATYTQVNYTSIPASK